MIRRWWILFRHYFGCRWVLSPAGMRRACGGLALCGRRQVLSSDSGYGSWEDHTYPLDADPTKDRTPIYREGMPTTVGTENLLGQIFQEVFTKKPVPQASMHSPLGAFLELRLHHLNKTHSDLDTLLGWSGPAVERLFYSDSFLLKLRVSWRHGLARFQFNT